MEHDSSFNKQLRKILTIFTKNIENANLVTSKEAQDVTMKTKIK